MLLSLQLLQDVGDELLAVPQFVLPLLRDGGAAVRPRRPQQGSQRRATVTVLTWNTNTTSTTTTTTTKPHQTECLFV